MERNRGFNSNKSLIKLVFLAYGKMMYNDFRKKCAYTKSGMLSFLFPQINPLSLNIPFASCPLIFK